MNWMLTQKKEGTRDGVLGGEELTETKGGKFLATQMWLGEEKRGCWELQSSRRCSGLCAVLVVHSAFMALQL